MTKYKFSDFTSTSDLGFFTMEVLSGNETVVFCGGSKELQNIECQIKSGESISKFSSYMV